MVPGYVQDMSRVPPDQPEGGGRGGLYSECLWCILSIQHRTSNFQHRNAGQSHPKPLQCDIKATTKPVDSQLIGTPKPPQSHLKATPMRPQCDPKATSKPPQSRDKPGL